MCSAERNFGIGSEFSCISYNYNDFQRKLALKTQKS
jgi:hypothetical protein